MIRLPSSLEPLESRIAPAVLPVINTLPDIEAGSAKTGASVDLTELFDTKDHHTFITFSVNIDSDPDTDGLQPSTFVMELFDDLAPQTVQNFLTYALNPNAAGDYLNTFFHRSLSGFVVQGGGFDVSNPTKHIPVGPNVHNEFDVSRSNVLGTVAMAKTGQGPNTATSEWFVNIADNSSNLDDQNGGFTVFGQIVSGLDLFTKIAALPKTSLAGGLTDVPVQNYNSDPDHNPNTPPPTPTPNQLIRITGVDVVPPSGTAPGYDFNHAPVITSVQGATDLIAKAEIVGGKLNLTYAPGKSGIVDVKVLVTNGDDSYEDTFRVTVLPNLIANVATDSLPLIIAPGDIGSAVVKLTNNGSGKYAGNTDGLGTTNVDVKFYLSKVTPTDEAGTIVDDDDIFVGSLLDQPIKLNGGASTSLTVPLKVPLELIDLETQGYHLIAKVTPSAGSTGTPELFAVGTDADDNTAVDGKVHALVNKAGTVNVPGLGARVIPKVTFLDGNGDKVVVTHTGPGFTDVIPTDNPDGNDFNLLVSASSILSTVAVRATTQTGASARLELHNIDVDSPLGALNLAAADVDGYTTISAGIRSLSMGNLSGNHTMIIGALLPSNTATTIKLGQVTDYNLESDQPIAQLTAVNWLDNTGIDSHIIAPSLAKLNIKGASGVAGNLEADVTLEGRGQVNLFRVAGVFQDATFTALKSGGVSVVSVGGMNQANFFLGTAARPDDLGDFTRSRTIGSFTVTGAATAGGFSFIDSQIAAGTITAIKLVHVDTASGDSTFGIVADKIASYIRDNNAPLTNLTKPKLPPAPPNYDSVGNYSVTVL